MNPKVKQFLTVIRVLDENGNISLTNIALVATLGNLLTCHSLSLEAVGVFLSSLVAYNVKRFVKPEAPVSDTEELQKAIEKLKTQVTGLTMTRRP